MENITALRGTKDILPDEAGLWRFIEERSRAMFDLYGFKEIRTPILESAELFIRGVGRHTDIVQKEMFAFVDKGKRNIALRPEATASVARAYVEHGMDKQGGVAKLYYIGAMFRGERPQSGRQRQFHQLGIEAIGSNSPYIDAEALILLSELLNSFGVREFSIYLNNIGCHKDRPKIAAYLKEEMSPFKKKFCDNCKRRMEQNVFRVLDCKEDICRRLIAEDIFKERQDIFPVCDECKRHFEKVKDILASAKIIYAINPFLARGLDYYTQTIFELTHSNLGAKDALGAGGRYDHLIAQMGAKETGAIGWSIGIERLISVIVSLAQQDEHKKMSSTMDFYISPLGDGSIEQAFNILSRLRQLGISSDMDYLNRGLKAQLKTADRLGAKWTGILGGDELSKGILTVRDMETGKQTPIRIDALEEEIKNMRKVRGL